MVFKSGQNFNRTEKEEEEERKGKKKKRRRRRRKKFNETSPFPPAKVIDSHRTRTIRCQRVAFFVARVAGSMRSMLHTTCRERERERGHALMRRAYRGTMCSEN